MLQDPVPTFSSRLPATAVVIMDDFLNPPIPEDEIERINQMRDMCQAGKYNWAFKHEIEAVSSHLFRFYKQAVHVMGLDEDQLVGIEYWINIFGPGDGIHMHSDLDETLFRRTRRMECAVAGTMCFAATRNLRGGSFVFEDGIAIRPRANRAVLFMGGTRHGVEPVIEGERRAVLVAFWHRVPTAYQAELAKTPERLPKPRS